MHACVISILTYVLKAAHTYDKTPERLFACVSELLTVNVPKLVFSQSY